MDNREYKRCPFCSEMIRVEAIKCKHCNSLLFNERLVKNYPESKYHHIHPSDNEPALQDALLQQRYSINKKPKTTDIVVFIMGIAIIAYSVYSIYNHYLHDEMIDNIKPDSKSVNTVEESEPTFIKEAETTEDEVLNDEMPIPELVLGDFDSEKEHIKLDPNTINKKEYEVIINENIKKSVGNIFINRNTLVNGNITLIYSDLSVDGDVKGDITSNMGQVSINGIIEGNVETIVGQITIAGIVSGDVSSQYGDVIINGIVTGNINSKKGKVLINGTVYGDVVIEEGEIEYGPNCIINGRIIKR